MTTATLPRPAVRPSAPAPRSFDAPSAEIERRLILARSELGLAEAATAALADIREG